MANKGVEQSSSENFLTFLWSTPSILLLSNTTSGSNPFNKVLVSFHFYNV